MEKKKGFETELFRKTVFMLVAIEDGISKTDLAKKCDITYSHTFGVLKSFQKRKLITLQATGRRKLITLTDKGNELRERVIYALEFCKGCDV